MNEYDRARPSEEDSVRIQAQAETPPRDWLGEDDASEIKGWALQWDTAALRKANLARQMRELREASGNP